MVVIHNGRDPSIGIDLCEPAQCAGGERMMKGLKLRAVALQPCSDVALMLGTAQKGVRIA